MRKSLFQSSSSGHITRVVRNATDVWMSGLARFVANRSFAVKVRDDQPNFDEQKAQIFHNFTAKSLFATKRARPDIHTSVAFLTTRVIRPDEDYWNTKDITSTQQSCTRIISQLFSSRTTEELQVPRELNIWTPGIFSSPTKSRRVTFILNIVPPKIWSRLFLPNLFKARNFYSSEK